MLRLKKAENLLLFLTLLFLPTQLGRHFWPNFSYIYSLKIDYLSPTLYFWDILVIGLLLVWCFNKPKFNKLALNLLLFFLFTQAISLIESTNLGVGLVRLEQYFVVGFFGLYLASQDIKNLAQKIYWPLVLGILGESIIAIFQFVKGGTLGLWILGERSFSISTPGIAKFDFYGLQFLRPYATFPHPNVLAAFMLIGICILYQSLREKRRLSMLAVFLGSITIFLTMSRVALLVGIGLLLFLVKKKWFVWILLVFLILSPILFTRFSSLFNFDYLTLLRREELLGDAWQIFLNYPFLGIGLNNFIPAGAVNIVTGPNRFLQPVHNIFLLSLAETGIVGLVGFLLLIGYPIWRMFNEKFKVYNFIPWLIILFLGMFDHYFLTLPQGYRLLFLVWGISLSMLK